MQVYNVGPNEVGFPEKPQYVWVVADYECGNWDGSGWAAALRQDGLLDIYNLGHCSCYGPEEDWQAGSVQATQSVEEFFRPKESVHDIDANDLVKQKVAELLGLTPGQPASATVPAVPRLGRQLRALDF